MEKGDRLDPRLQYTFTDSYPIAEISEALQGEQATISGRVLAHRRMKNFTFLDVSDDTGSMQVISSAEDTADHDEINEVEIGDYVGINGRVGQSRSEELSLFATDWVRLAKTELSFPDKRHGLTDPDTIARQRYLDLATNRESMERFRQRSRIVSLTRSYMEERDFIEVETPVLQLVHGGASAKPFETHHNALDLDLSLRIAPELYLKRLIVGGFKRVYEIGKVFRNEGISTRHNPEFTMMEAYAAGWDYEDQMRLTEGLVSSLAVDIKGSTQFEYQGQEVDVTTPWERRTMDSLVSEKLGEEVSVDTDIAKLRQMCDSLGIHYSDANGQGKLLLELYEKTVESTLWGPIFVTDHPVEVSPLARSHRSRPGYTERFEGIVAGRELCNAFTELNDPRIQYERFADQESTSDEDDEAMRMDVDYVRALQYGLPPTAGMGIGIDRLAMLLTNARSIRDVILFPTMRPESIEDPYADKLTSGK